MTFEEDSHAYIVENGRNIRGVTIVCRSGEFYIVRFNDKWGVKLRGSRLYATQEEAEKSLPKEEKRKRTGYWSPYDYLHFTFFQKGVDRCDSL